MVLAPADFYAYSRATGVPVPEDPEERAQIAPEVLAFRRNQLVAPREESNLLQNLGLAAAGVGAAGLGFLGTRRLLSRQPAAAEELVSGRQPSEEAVRQVAKTSAIGNVVRDLNQPPPSKVPNLTDVQVADQPKVAENQNATVDSGVQQFLQRRAEENQRNISSLNNTLFIPQEERNYAPSRILLPSRRTLREDKLINRLTAEQTALNEAVLSPESWNESFLSTQTASGPLNYPSSLVNVYKGEQVNVLGPSSPLRETYSAFAQIDPEMVDRQIQGVIDDPELSPGQKEGALYRLQQLKQASEGVRGEAGVTALALSRQGRLPYTSLLDEPISGVRGEMREVLNPAYVEAMSNYWERRAAELPHTIVDYEKRKTAGLLNYQLPETQRSSHNNAQTFSGWDKATSEALQEIYESEVGDTPQYVMELRPARGEEARARIDEQEEYTGSIQKYFEKERAPGTAQPRDINYLAVHDPQVYPAMRRQGGQFVGFPSYNLSSIAAETRSKPIRFKGPETGHIIDTVPLAINSITENEIAPGVTGQFSTTEIVHAPLQRVQLTTNPKTGEITPHLVNFQIRLDSEISPYTAALVGVSPRTSIQNAVQSIKDLHGDDYATINKKVNLLLKNTVGETPIMTQKPFDKYDESRRQFINMLSGVSYETPQKGFLVGVNGEQLPYTGPQTRAKSAFEGEQMRRTNIIDAQRQLSTALESGFRQQGLNPQEISTRTQELVSQYLPGFNEAGVIISAKPQVSSSQRVLSGQPLPEIMQRPAQGEELRSAYYPRLEPGLGGAVSSQLRNLLKNGAQVTTDPAGTPGAKVHYTMGDKTVSYPRKQLIETLKKENQDAPNIAALTGITLKSEGQVVSGPHTTLSSRTPGEPGISPMQRSAKPGYYYNEFGELMQEPTVSTFTGPARFAAGSAFDVLTGNYPEGGSRVSVRTSPSAEIQEFNRWQLAASAEGTPGGRMVRGAVNLGQPVGNIPAGLGQLSEAETIAKYGATGSQLQELGNILMAQAAYKKGLQPGPTARTTARPGFVPTADAPTPFYGPSAPPVQGPSIPPLGITEMNRELVGYSRRPNTISTQQDVAQSRADAVARHIGNYISAASSQLTGPASIQGVKLKGIGQNVLRPYQAPSEGMIQQLMRAARRR